MMSETREEKQSLWLLAASPLAWSVHFLASYFLAAVWCAKVAGRGGSLFSVRVSIAVFTLAALLAIAVVARLGHKRRQRGRSYDRDTALDRHRFLGYAASLLSLVSAIGVIYTALTAVFIGTCW